MSKKLTFSKKASTDTNNNQKLDAFVGIPAVPSEPPPTSVIETPPAPTEKMKRFTFDVPEALHRRIKMQCAGKGVDMADEMRRLLEEKFPESK